MKPLSIALKQALSRNERYYLAYADITLVDSTELNLTNSEIWNGGFSYEEAVSEDNAFTALGSVIMGSAKIIINNIYGTYSSYDFTNAECDLSLGLELYHEDGTSTIEKFKVGKYIVDDTSYNGGTITLSLLDRMERFDRLYTTNLTFPASLYEILAEMCTTLGIYLNTPNFPHKTTIVAKPTKDGLTYREVLSWIAQIAGCYAKFNPDGQLELNWFNQQALEQGFTGIIDGGRFNPWEIADVADGGSFNPWNTGDVVDGGTFTDTKNIHYLINLKSQNIAMDDVVITGVTIRVKNEGETAITDFIEYTSGTSGYIIILENNEFITHTNAQTVVNWLGQQVIGLRFRKFNISQISDPSIEAGDVGIVIDRKDNVYRALITRQSFSISTYQTIVCGAQTPSRNSATRYSNETKNYVEARKLFDYEKTQRQLAVEQLEQAISQSGGLYTTIVTPQGGGNIYYMHNTPDLANATIVWKMTAEAWAVTDDWQGSDAATEAAHKWNAGMLVNGDVIARILYAIGVDADWINTGVLQVKNGNTELLYADVENGALRISGYRGGTRVFYLNTADGTLDINASSLSISGVSAETTTGAQNKADAIDNALTQLEICKRLANSNGTDNTKGIWISGNTLYINASAINAGTLSASRIYGGTLKLGGAANVNGVFEVYDNSNTKKWSIDNSGLEYTINSTGSLTIGKRGRFVFQIEDDEVESGQTIRYLAYAAVDSIESGTWKGQFADSRWQGTIIGRVTGVYVYDVPYNKYAQLNGQSGLELREGNRIVSHIGRYGNLAEAQFGTVPQYDGDVKIYGSFIVSTGTSGQKSAAVETDSYGTRLLYCYETPSPMFGDIGEGTINEDGQCYVYIETIFSKTIADVSYQVFLQPYGEGQCYVSTRNNLYFIVTGTPGLQFGWEIKAKQKYFGNTRLENFSADKPNLKNEISYGNDAIGHIQSIQNERSFQQ